MAASKETESLLNESSNSITELSGCGGSLACDPRRYLHKYLVLIFICLLSFGSYFCYDNPAALEDQMKDDLSLTTTEYMAFYSWYSWPNVILCFFGGFLIDTVFGLRLGAIMFSIFILVGQVIFGVGAYTNTYWVMCLARFIFGVGGESLAVVQNTYAVSWFKGRELNMVFGLQLSLSRIGSTVNMNVMKPLYNSLLTYAHGYKAMGATLLIASTTCLFSLICALILGYFDLRRTKILKLDTAKTGDVVKISDIRHFPGTFWLLCIICVAYYVTVFPFIGLGLVFFEMKYEMPHETATLVNSLVYILSAAASPFFGFFIDKTGRNVYWVFFGTFLTLLCHFTLAFFFLTPFVAMIVMGLAYSILASSLWPMVSLMVPESRLGTAYGLMQALQNLGLASVSLAMGAIVDSKGYLYLELFNLMCLCFTLLIVVVLYLLDSNKGGYLNLSAKERRLLDSKNEETDKEK